MNKNKKGLWIGIGIAILLITNLMSFYGGSIVSLYAPNGKVMVSRSDKKKFNDLFKVRDQLYKYYDGKISDSVLLEGAIKGMTDSLNDPYTVYMNKKEYDSFNSEITGSYSGIGVQVEAQDDKLVIVTVFEDSPAKKAGILTDDVILKVDGKEVSGKNLDAAVSLIKGAQGTSLTLTVNRPTKGVMDIKLARDKIVMNTVKGEVLDNGIGYIRISMFDDNTGNSFNDKLKELKSKNIKGLIIDLRENPGGSLEQCVDVTSNFVKKGEVIVSTIDKYKNKEVLHSKGGIGIGMPLVVLVDQNTASASEIFSGAVKDYNVATLVGKKTFGKGIVQQIFPDPNGSATKITVSKYYTPKGVNIHKIGINPDIVVDYPEELKTKAYDRNVDPQFQKALQVMEDKLK